MAGDETGGEDALLGNVCKIQLSNPEPLFRLDSEFFERKLRRILLSIVAKRINGATRVPFGYSLFDLDPQAPRRFKLTRYALKGTFKLGGTVTECSKAAYLLLGVSAGWLCACESATAVDNANSGRALGWMKICRT